MENKNNNAIKQATLISEKATKKAIEKSRLKLELTEVKEMKIGFSKELCEYVSKAYAHNMVICESYNVFRNNLKHYNKEIEVLEQLEILEKEEREKLEKLNEMVDEAKACFNYFKRKEIKSLLSMYEKLSENLYISYFKKFEDKSENFKTEIKEFFKSFNVNVSDDVTYFIDRAMGQKSQSKTSYKNGPIKSLSRKEFNNLFLDILITIGIEKNQITKRHIEETFDGDILMDFDKYCKIPVIKALDESAKKLDYIKVLERVGAEYTNKMSKDELREVYKKSIKKELFVEIKK